MPRRLGRLFPLWRGLNRRRKLNVDLDTTGRQRARLDARPDPGNLAVRGSAEAPIARSIRRHRAEAARPLKPSCASAEVLSQPGIAGHEAKLAGCPADSKMDCSRTGRPQTARNRRAPVNFTCLAVTAIQTLLADHIEQRRRRMNPLQQGSLELPGVRLEDELERRRHPEGLYTLVYALRLRLALSAFVAASAPEAVARSDSQWTCPWRPEQPRRGFTRSSACRIQADNHACLKVKIPSSLPQARKIVEKIAVWMILPRLTSLPSPFGTTRAHRMPPISGRLW